MNKYVIRIFIDPDRSDVMDLDSIIDFLKKIEGFKTCERTCQTTRAGRAESDAEHSWHLALLLVLLENEFKGIDLAKLLKMALIHDLPELYAGDTNPYRDQVDQKEENEKGAARKLFSNLPAPVGESLHALFEEYLQQQSLEARIVKSADKLMPLIQNLCTNEYHSSYRKLKVSYEEVVRYMEQFFPDDILGSIYRKLLSEAVEQGVFFNINKSLARHDSSREKSQAD